MELANYLKTLLYNNDILIIPGFGGFQTSYRPAEIKTDDHSITPPMKFLTFDAKMLGDNDLIVRFIAKEKNFSENDAKDFVKQQVDLLLQKLSHGETIFFEGIGYFSMKEQVIRFDREHDSNFLTDSYGLSTIQFQPVEISLEPQHIPEKNSSVGRRSISNMLLMVLGIILLGGVITAYFYYPGLRTRFFKHHIHPKVVASPAVPVDTSSGKSSLDTTKSNDLAKFLDSKTKQKNALAINTAKPVKPSSGKSYFIIAGSFKTFKRANILTKKLQKEGYKPEVLQFNEDLFRVSIGEYGEKTEAIQECDKIRASRGKESVWVLAN